VGMTVRISEGITAAACASCRPCAPCGILSPRPPPADADLDIAAGGCGLSAGAARDARQLYKEVEEMIGWEA